MRVRMVRRTTEMIDGVDLSSLKAGLVYNLDPAIATYLLALGLAGSEMRTAPAPVLSGDSPKLERRRRRKRLL